MSVKFLMINNNSAASKLNLSRTHLICLQMWRSSYATVRVKNKNWVDVKDPWRLCQFEMNINIQGLWAQLCHLLKRQRWTYFHIYRLFNVHMNFASMYPSDLTGVFAFYGTGPQTTLNPSRFCRILTSDCTVAISRLWRLFYLLSIPRKIYVTWLQLRPKVFHDSEIESVQCTVSSDIFWIVRSFGVVLKIRRRWQSSIENMRQCGGAAPRHQQLRKAWQIIAVCFCVASIHVPDSQFQWLMYYLAESASLELI